MRSLTADGESRLLSWRRVREFAVPALMIETATARRTAGDWAGACAAAHVDVDLDLRAVTSGYGREFAARVRADLRRLAPDLLRWHLPRTVSNGLLRPGLTMSLVRYPWADHHVHLVARTAPSWADAGQRVSLAVWDPAEPDVGPHPRPRPDRRFRLDLHSHLWAADQAPQLRERCGLRCPEPVTSTEAAWMRDVPVGRGYAVDRWTAEAALLRVADGCDGPVVIRLGNGRRILLPGDRPDEGDSDAHNGNGDDDNRGNGGGDTRRNGNGGRHRNSRGDRGRNVAGCGGSGAPVLPYAATWRSPDLDLLQAGMITAELLHPLVAEALAPVPAVPVERVTPVRADDATGRADGIRLVECCGEVHRLGLVDGRLTPLDHEAGELHREDLLAAFGGPPLPCLRAMSATARQPDCLDEVRTRLDHGDHTGAVALVVELIGPDAEPEGALRAAFIDAEEGRIEHGLYRAGLAARFPIGVTAPIGPREDRAGRRGRHHRLPRTNRTSDHRLPRRAAVLR